MRNSIIIGVAVSVLTGTAGADMTTIGLNPYSITATDFDGSALTLNVVDMYLLSDDGADVLLNIYNLELPAAAQRSYFQSFTGTGWTPTNLGGPFDTPALRVADSFVTIGGFDFANPEQAPGAGAGTGLDPNFGGNNASHPGFLAGWYNGSPPSLGGRVGDTPIGLGVLIARFSSTQDLDPGNFVGTTLEATWNQGLGTPGIQAEFMVMPAPGSLALLAIAGLGRTRRRG